MHVLIVGAGLMGTTTAWYLRQHGVDVTVLDRAEGAGMETSFANAGMLTPSMADPWNAPGVLSKLLRWVGKDDAPMLLRPQALPSLLGWGIRFMFNSRPARFRKNTLRNVAIAHYSLEQLRSLRTELALDYDQTLGGTLRACRDQASLDHAASLAGFLADHGVEYQVLDRQGVVRAEPGLRPIAEKLVGGVHYVADESGDAHLFTRGLCDAARMAGVVFRFGAKVTGFTRVGDRLNAVQVGDEEIPADAIILAAGSFTPPLARMLGLRVPVRPVKGYSITLPRGDWPDGPRIPVADDHLHAAVTPLGDRIRVAGTAEFAGYDDRVRPARIRNLLSLLEMIYPEYASRIEPGAAEPWCGFRPMSADGVPILGPTPIPNLYVNVGQGHLGWTMSAGSGKLVADLVAGASPDLPMNNYSLDRF
ncbi:MAG: D-amino acid dehydrogenase [Gammaproteobacteria bacterium]|jgi:D-amino-acid dehydrogenase